MTFAATVLTAKLLKLYMALLIIIAFFTWKNPVQKTPTLYQINRETHQHLHSLIQTKYFRMIRVNLNRECELWVRNKICKSKSCTVCRCDQKDIPTNWIKTDQVNQGLGGKDLWEKQRDPNQQSINWIWHVEDQQNDQGEYFDLYSNVESFTNYDGRSIWKLVYEENCFNISSKTNRSEEICKQEAVFYKVISGLHTSISTHISLMYKNITPDAQMWTGLKNSEQFFVNYDEYRRRVLDYPDRVQNLLFIYQIYLRAMKQIAPYLIQNYTINSDNIVEDLKTARLLQQLSKKFENYEFKPFDAEIGTFFYPQNPKVQLYQKYIHNISRLMNCVECQKCRLFGKMQTYGIGTALKILLGYNAFYKRNEMVAFFNAWNKISMSVDFYYQTKGAPKKEIHYNWRPLKLFAVIFGALIVFSFIIEYFAVDSKFSGKPKSEQGTEEKKLLVEKADFQKNQ